MYKRNQVSWIKHLDFTIVDLLMLEFSYMLAYGLRFSWHSPFQHDLYSQVALIFALVSVGVSAFTSNYHGILKRGVWAELRASFIKLAVVMLVVFAYFFITQQGLWYSRLALGGTAVLSILFTWAGRSLWKQCLYRIRRHSRGLPQLLVIAPPASAAAFIRSFSSVKYKDFAICGIVPLGDGPAPADVEGMPVVANAADYLDYVRTNVVDEVFLESSDEDFSYAVTDNMLKMGITVHTHINNRLNDSPNTFMEKMGDYTVLTTGISVASMAELLAKRLMDILGSLVGLALCGIAFLFVAPGIYFSSPGPIFFKQERVGKHGRTFKFYKFRSMYLDAEQQKAKLMDQNQMQGFMFKMDNDPRVFPFGRFIRKTSIDELPNFWNVLKGDMSLVGTRPPTMDEYKKYELHHRVRLAIKPGITGLWQISGRSEVTDFEEVVRLDQKYIENWSLGLDVKILLKTVWVVLTRKGSA